MPTDSFTGKPIPKGHGMMYVKKDGTVYWFANKKSEKSFLRLHRTPGETKWTDFYHKEKRIKLKPKSGVVQPKSAELGTKKSGSVDRKNAEQDIHWGSHGAKTGAAAEKK